MHRIIKIAVGTAGLAAASLMASATVASATVTVTDGVGHVDKGDVQTVLKWNNGDFDKKAGSLKFARTMTRTTDNVWHCTGIDETQHSYRVTVMDQSVKSAPVFNSNGKQITGFDLTGAASAPYAVISDTGSNPAGTLACPEGSSVDFTKPFSINQIGVAKYTTYTYGDLTVNGVALPNTQVA